jgi:hypothetical protein
MFFLEPPTRREKQLSLAGGDPLPTIHACNFRHCAPNGKPTCSKAPLTRDNGLFYRDTSFEQIGSYALRNQLTIAHSERSISGQPSKETLKSSTRSAEFALESTSIERVYTLDWLFRVDFDPAILHDWPEHEAVFRSATQCWSRAMS